MPSTPPHALVSSFRFVTSSSAAPDEGISTLRQELDAGVGEWKGRAVFVSNRPGSGSGTSTSPIHISPTRSPSPPIPPPPPPLSSSPAPALSSSPVPILLPHTSPTMTSLPRPRGIPAYSSSRSRTAYTPPRNILPDKGSASTKPRPIHPFFSRSRSVPIPSTSTSAAPPASGRPRLVAHYSSTSESIQSQTTQATESTLESIRVERSGEIEELELSEMMRVVDIARQRQSSTTPTPRMTKPTKSTNTVRARRTKPAAPKQTTIPSTSDPLPRFSYKTYPDPSPCLPRIAYTSSTDEANDLLACLRGPVLGFDIEWPVKFRKVGVEQGRTALMQFCDDRLVVLIHLTRMKDLPQQAVDILADRRTYKTGVSVRNDALKLLRDFPTQFASGISGLLELSHLARRADPIATGPGAQLISLANLGRAYLGCEIDKDAKVRRGDWSRALSPIAIEYATNDVWSSLYIYKALAKIAEERGIPIDLNAMCLVAGNAADQVAPRAKTQSPVNLDQLDPVTPTGPTPRPAELRAFNKFAAGMTAVEIADEGGIKETTVQGYILRALSLLPPDALAVVEKKRLLEEVKGSDYIIKVYSKVYKRMRIEVGDPVSGSDVEEEADEPIAPS